MRGQCVVMTEQDWRKKAALLKPRLSKFNPNHDELGRFTHAFTSIGGTSTRPVGGKHIGPGSSYGGYAPTRAQRRRARKLVAATMSWRVGDVKNHEDIDGSTVELSRTNHSVRFKTHDGRKWRLGKDKEQDGYRVAERVTGGWNAYPVEPTIDAALKHLRSPDDVIEGRRILDGAFTIPGSSHIKKFNQNHDEIGRFSTADRNTTGVGSTGGSTKGKKKSGPYRTKNVKDAALRLSRGEDVELESVEQVSTLLTELRRISLDAQKRGKAAPNYNLCKISVPGTNVFCADNKGVKRLKMPQLGGTPRPGSKADKLPKSKEGQVDATDAFIKHMRDRGVKVTRKAMKAANLRATQSELIGKKVAGMLDSYKQGKFDPGKRPIFVSKDGYVIDGHHRWATVVGMDSSDGKLGDLSMNVIQVDTNIGQVLKATREFADDFGIRPKGVSKMIRCVGCDTNTHKPMTRLETVR